MQGFSQLSKQLYMNREQPIKVEQARFDAVKVCLLYTSDAADE